MIPVPSLCRICSNGCGILVDVEDGAVRRVTGDPDNPLSLGYTCTKGRAQPELLRHPDRLLGARRRGPDGTFEPIAATDAVAEIASRLREVIDRHGPGAVALYRGTMSGATNGTAGPFAAALMASIGSPMVFDPNTIDKGGKQVAQSFLGRWQAPAHGFGRPDIALLIGINPLLTYTGLPAGNPGAWLNDARRRGMELIVIDPRRTEVARRASLHLQPAPGHDPEILAAMVRVVLVEDLLDHAFVAAEVEGLDRLAAAVEPFRPNEVARRAGVEARDLVRAARMFAGGRRGFAMAGTGPSMAGTGTLTEYLVLVLETLCGHWRRAGDPVDAPPTLGPAPTYRAQAQPPDASWSRAPHLRTRDLRSSAAGVPVSALADEILLPGAGQVRALLCWAGNPAVAFPDQARVVAALRSLDLFVQLDAFPSASARLADYVVATTMPLEAAGATTQLESLTARGTGYGLDRAHAQVSPAVAAPPAGADVVEEWWFFREVLRHLTAGGLPNPLAVELMDPDLTTDRLLGLLCAGGRVPYEEVLRHPHGAHIPGPTVVVLPKEPGWRGRLDVGSEVMLGDLRTWVASGMPSAPGDADLPFRLVCRRHGHVYNSSCNVPATNRGRGHNPAYLHGDDLAALGVEPGDLVEIRSSLGAIPAVVAADPGLRRGLVSMAFGFGAGPETDGDVRLVGSSTSRLVPIDAVYDRYVGQPRMSNLPVAVRALEDPA